MTITPTQLDQSAAPIPFVSTLSVSGITGTLTGGMNIISSARAVQLNVQDLRASEAIGDAEGSRRARTEIVKNSVFTTASVIYAGQQIVNWIHPAVASLSVLGTAMYSLYGIGSLVGIAVSAVGFYRSLKFRYRGSEALFERIRGMSDEQIFTYLERRTSKEIAEKILSGQDVSEEEIQAANWQNIKMHAIAFLASTLFLVGIILFNLTPIGAIGSGVMFAATVIGLLPWIYQIVLQSYSWMRK